MKKIVRVLKDRYINMVRDSPRQYPISDERISDMMWCIYDNADIWPVDKTNRWIGYTQCLLIEVMGLTTVQAERDFTRPLFHEYYRENGIEIPESVEV